MAKKWGRGAPQPGCTRRAEPPRGTVSCYCRCHHLRANWHTPLLGEYPLTGGGEGTPPPSTRVPQKKFWEVRKWPKNEAEERPAGVRSPCGATTGYCGMLLQVPSLKS